jgi:pyruvate/oxaloacetate carboxyltransferase
MVCQPAQDIALGKYGLTPGPIDPAVLAQVEKQTCKKRVTDRPADLLEPGLEKHRQQCAEKGLPTDDETVVLFAMFPQQVEDLHRAKTKPAPAASVAAPVAAPVAPAPPPALVAPVNSGPILNGVGKRLFITVNNQRHDVTVESLDS